MREPRFPNIDWYCDNCNALLNNQKGFDDHKYIWKCTGCGYKNSISWSNIIYDDPPIVKFLLYVLGFISYISFWTSVMLGVAMFCFQAEKKVFLVPFYIFIGIYFVAYLFDLLIEFTVRHKKITILYAIKVFFRNLKEDFVAPFLSVRELVNSFIHLVLNKLHIRTKFKWYNNRMIVIRSLFCTLIALIELYIFIKITKIELNSLVTVIPSILNFVRNFISSIISQFRK